MKKPFTHPLARHATLTRSQGRDGAEHETLVIVTTLELDPKAKRYKGLQVERLNAAARSYLEEVPEISSFAVVSRPKDWSD